MEGQQEKKGSHFIDEEVTRLIREYYPSPSPYLARLRKQQEEEGLPIILPDTEMFLVSLLTAAKPGRILEIGTAGGYSSSLMAHVLRYQEDLDIFTIEQDEALVKQAEKVIGAQKLHHRIHCLCGDGREAVALLEKETFFSPPEPFDFIFIDGGKSHYRYFWDQALELSKRGAMIVCDNILLKGSVARGPEKSNRRHKTNIVNMREFLDQITGNPQIQTGIFPVGDGMSVSHV